ncbi:MAG: hypothetical protein JXB10_15585 [Pirellulales bacterium]|nr:hypothetical protein [Pirellulales bacterium]
MPHSLDDLIAYWPWAVLAAGVLFALGVLRRWLRRRKRRKPLPAAPPPIDVQKLINQGPPAGPPTLEFYNIPVRLAALTLAPVGRSGSLPPEEELPGLFEALLPGLAQIVQLHQPPVRHWPNQFSTRGFAQAFFQNAKWPGEHCKGTPWSAVAGIFKHEGQPYMAALVLRAAGANSLGQITLGTEYDWLGCLRVKVH